MLKRLCLTALALLSAAALPLDAARPGRKPSRTPTPEALAGPAGSPDNVSPPLAKEKLVSGNERFASGRSLRPHLDTELRSRQTWGERPWAAVLTCSEPQSVPEVIFDQGLGDLFVVRNAGPAVSEAGTASLEYAVREHGVKLVVLMAHERCSILGRQVVRKKRPGIKSGPGVFGDMTTLELPAELATEVEEGKPYPGGAEARARGELRDLMRRSALLQDRVDAGQLSVQAAVYNPDSGRVSWVGVAKPRPDETPRGWRRAKDGIVEWSQIVGQVGRAARGVPTRILRHPVIMSLGPSLADSGLRKGDVLVDFDGQQLRDLRQLDDYEAQVDPGSLVPVKVWRDGATLSAKVKVLRIDQIFNDLAPGEPQEKTLGSLGVKVRFLQGQEARSRGYARCLLVQSVLPGKPAARAGIAAGDLLLMCNLYSTAESPFQMAPEMVTRVRRGGNIFAVTLRK